MQSRKFNKLVNKLLREADKTKQPLVVLFGDEDLSSIRCMGDLTDPYIRSCISDLKDYALRQPVQTGEMSSQEGAQNAPV